jgi:hypothetical protein
MEASLQPFACPNKGTPENNSFRREGKKDKTFLPRASLHTHSECTYLLVIAKGEKQARQADRKQEFHPTTNRGNSEKEKKAQKQKKKAKPRNPHTRCMSEGEEDG